MVVKFGESAKTLARLYLQSKEDALKVTTLNKTLLVNMTI